MIGVFGAIWSYLRSALRRDAVMSDPKVQQRWPEYLPAPSDDVFAIGVVALNYGQMESMFKHLFAVVTRMNDFQVSALFYRIPNNTRLNVLSDLMNQTTLPEKLKDRVLHFCDGFKICAANRHA